MRYWIEFRPPWRADFPLSAGFKFELFSCGYYRFAGGGFAVSLCILSFSLAAKFIKKGNEFGLGQQQIKGLRQL